MPYLRTIASCPEPIDCRILTAALDLFIEKGYHRVSIHEIQKQADVSIGSIYKYFGGKEGVASALHQHLIGEFNELVDDVKEVESSPLEQCMMIIKQLFKYTETRRNIIAFLFNTNHSDFLSHNATSSPTPFCLLQNIIEQGIKTGEFKENDSQVATSFLFGSVTQFIQLRLEGDIDKPLTDYYEAIVDIVRKGLI
jgi:AcrR family transcriptional regulator